MSIGITEITKIFSREFGGGKAVAAIAPGRVNLIGEHTDYNDGFVLPMAIDFGVAVAGRRRNDRKARLYSADYGEYSEIDLDEKYSALGPRWSMYVEGVARTIEDETGEAPPGFDAVIKGDVPQGAGLSSSAALETASGFFLNRLHSLGLPERDIALCGQRAEHNYLGVRCGIMDQFASALCGRETALFLDCRSLDFERAPLRLGKYVIMILDSKKSRGLVGSAYNDRRRACEEGVKLMRQWAPEIKALRDITPEMFEEYGGRLPSGVAAKCRHIITENQRVLDAVDCLKRGELDGFGKLMWQSHDSLRDDYEVSCPELDALNEIARAGRGVAGERMTGAGFGGCGVALVERDAAAAFSSELMEKYRERTGLTPVVHITGASGGAECFDI